MSALREINTTIKNYIREQEDNILRNRKLTALMKSKGRLTFNASGESFVWRVRYRRGPMQGYADSEVLVFAPRDRWKTAELGWRGYALTDMMSKGERLRNKGKEAIINAFDEITKSMMDDATEAFGDELYGDGDAANRQKSIHGIDSIFSGTDTTTYPGLIAPTKTYAGLSTVLGNYGGKWTGAWPSGSGDPHFDFWTPLQLNYTYGGASTPWTDGATFNLNGPQVLSYGIIKTQRNKSKVGMLDMILLEGELYRQFLESLRSIQRIMVQTNEKNSTLIKLGFTDVQNYDGVDVTWEYGTPAGYGYGFNVDFMEIKSLQGQLFVTDGVEYMQASKSYNFSIDFYGNMRINPRNMFRLKAAG